MENILGTGFYMNIAYNWLLTSTGEDVFRGKPTEDRVRKYFINNGEYRGSYLQCRFSLSAPNSYDVSVIDKEGSIIEKIILPLVNNK